MEGVVLICVSLHLRFHWKPDKGKCYHLVLCNSCNDNDFWNFCSALWCFELVNYKEECWGMHIFSQKNPMIHSDQLRLFFWDEIDIQESELKSANLDDITVIWLYQARECFSNISVWASPHKLEIHIIFCLWGLTQHGSTCTFGSVPNMKPKLWENGSEVEIVKLEITSFFLAEYCPSSFKYFPAFPSSLFFFNVFLFLLHANLNSDSIGFHLVDNIVHYVHTPYWSFRFAALPFKCRDTMLFSGFKKGIRFPSIPAYFLLSNVIA